tara:strand:- start:43796 stop:44077 length:282 start_codon:yes stop_codon:yes gene_type:complete
MKRCVFLALLVLFSLAANSFSDESQTQPTGDTSSIHFIQADMVLLDGVSEVDAAPAGKRVKRWFSARGNKNDRLWRQPAVRNSLEETRIILNI